MDGQPHVEGFEFWYWVRRLQARFLAADHAAALEASHRAQSPVAQFLRRVSCPRTFQAEHELYSALTHAAACDSASGDERRRHVESWRPSSAARALGSALPRELREPCALVAAEIARIEGRDADATRLYEQAIRSARENGFVNNEALALELAARFYAGRGLDRIARTYLRDARDGYRQWGADGKVRQLESAVSLSDRRTSRPTRRARLLTPVEHLDLSTVLKSVASGAG